MKLISFNIGIKINNSKKVAEFIISQNPDIVAFQEIVHNIDDSVLEMYTSRKIITEKISSKLPNSFFGPLFITDAVRKNSLIHRNFGGFIEQGNEIFSKFEIVKASNEFYHKNYSYGLDLEEFFLSDHPRAMQLVKLKINNSIVQIINIHGTYSKSKADNKRTLNQCKYLLSAAKRENLPTIIVGDFNLYPNSKSIAILNAKFTNLITEFKIKSTRPDFNDGDDKKTGVVDYIFVNEKIKVNDFKVLQTKISDHLPLILNFDIIT